MTAPNFTAKVKEFLYDRGIQASDADFKAMTETLQADYDNSVNEAKKTSQQPRTSTRDEVLEAGRAQITVNNEAATKNLPILEKKQDIFAKGRDRIIEGDINKHAALTDANTQSQLALMGGSFRDMQKDAFASKADSLQGNIGYYDRRDSKYVDVIKGDQALAQQGMNMDFIGKLVAGAALLAG